MPVNNDDTSIQQRHDHSCYQCWKTGWVLNDDDIVALQWSQTNKELNQETHTFNHWQTESNKKKSACNDEEWQWGRGGKGRNVSSRLNVQAWSNAIRRRKGASHGAIRFSTMTAALCCGFGRTITSSPTYPICVTRSNGCNWASDLAWYCMRGLRPKSPKTITTAWAMAVETVDIWWRERIRCGMPLYRQPYRQSVFFFCHFVVISNGLYESSHVLTIKVLLDCLFKPLIELELLSYHHVTRNLLLRRIAEASILATFHLS